MGPDPLGGTDHCLGILLVEMQALEADTFFMPWDEFFLYCASFVI